MPTYDDVFFNPPAPVARVTLRQAESGATLADTPMLIDYGGLWGRCDFVARAFS